jgi:hypothetical protein
MHRRRSPRLRLRRTLGVLLALTFCIIFWAVIASAGTQILRAG